jgi:glycosyltransferase involved in cell wall biosynthesis
MMPRVLERWPDARLIIVGEGAERRALQEEISRRGLGASILMLGQRHDVAPLLSLSDIFVFPSEGEGLGLALLEAACAGKPVVATNSGAVPEVVEDGVSGYLVEPGNHEALAEAVLRVAESTDRAQTMGLRGQQIARQRFDLRTSVRKLEYVYLSVLKGQAAA